jgi:1-acylglycerone phosphate reductase
MASTRKTVLITGCSVGGKLDVLVNDSGTGIILPALDTPIEDVRKVFDVNFWALLAMIQAFAPLLIKAKGCAVNDAGLSGVAPLVFLSIELTNSSFLTLHTNP